MKEPRAARYLSPGLNDQTWQSSAAEFSLRGVELAIYSGIWTGIADGTLEPGQKLDEAALCDIYGVSRTIVRRVLYKLEEQGIAALLPNRGAWVASPTLEEAVELAEIIRVALSHVAASLAAQACDISTDQRGKLARHLKAEHAAHEENGWHDCRRLRMELGTLLMLIYGNRTLAAVWQRHSMRFLIALSLYQGMWNTLEEARFAEVLIRHVLDGNPSAASKHIQDYIASLTRALRKSTASGRDLKSLLANSRQAAFVKVVASGAHQPGDTVREE